LTSALLFHSQIARSVFYLYTVRHAHCDVLLKRVGMLQPSLSFISSSFTYTHTFYKASSRVFRRYLVWCTEILHRASRCDHCYNPDGVVLARSLIPRGVSRSPAYQLLIANMPSVCATPRTPTRMSYKRLQSLERDTNANA